MQYVYGSDAPVWIDLLEPTSEEIARISSQFGVQLPSRAQLEEIESSSRLRALDKTLIMSMPLSTELEPALPAPIPLGFILTPQVLITVRYSDVHAILGLRTQLEKGTELKSAAAVFATLLEGMVDFGADMLEKLSADLATISQQVFGTRGRPRRHGAVANRNLRALLTAIGLAGERLSHISESVLGLQRICIFSAETEGDCLPADIRARLQTVRRDLASLADFETHLSDKSQFLLDAVLGFINTAQNDTFRVLTIVSVVGIPPTLIASMYGMNFHNMPEYTWHWGYQYVLVVIALSIIVPIAWFKWRGWW